MICDETSLIAPPLQPVQLPKEDAADVIRHLLEQLAAYIRENHALEALLADQDRQIAAYRKLIADFDRQKGGAS